MAEGLFIVLEGIDGVGKTHQARELRRRLQARGLPVALTQQPSDGPIGALLRQMLRGRVVVPGAGGPRPPSWSTMAALFAADRLDHLQAEVLPNLQDGVCVICDRYDHSTLAFQSIASGLGEAAVPWLLELNRHARRPDLTLVLDAPAEVGRQRRTLRGEAASLYEEDAMQAQLAVFYATIERHFPQERLVHIDAARNAEAVADDIERQVVELRGIEPLTSCVPRKRSPS